MFGLWCTHQQFQERLEKQLSELLTQSKKQSISNADALKKSYILNLDPLKELVTSCSFSTGRPAFINRRFSRPCSWPVTTKNQSAVFQPV